MTIQKILDRVNQLKPNKQADETKIAWLSELDTLIHTEIILTHETPHQRRTLMEIIVEVEPENRAEAIAEAEEQEEQDAFDGYTPDTDRDTVLLAPHPYDDVYMYYLFMQIDLQNQEIDKYNNNNALFQAAYRSLSAYWNRTHMHVQRTRELRL